MRDFLAGKVVLHHGDANDVVRELPDDYFHACCTDPPYALVSIVKRFANSPRSEATENTDNPYGRTGRGFMGQRWDNGSVAHDVAFWREVWRVLRPGAHIVAFGSPRTYHRLACAIEDAGFECRDCLNFLYGSGFPKSHNIQRQLERDWQCSLRFENARAAVKTFFRTGDQTAMDGCDFAPVLVWDFISDTVNPEYVRIVDVTSTWQALTLTAQAGKIRARFVVSLAKQNGRDALAGC